MPSLDTRAAAVRLLILDVDGVLTDGRLYYGENNEHFRAFHVRDGLGIRLLVESGVAVAVISGRSSRSLATRLEPLGVRDIYQGQEDKQPAFAELLNRHRLVADQVAYMGDDLQDLPLLSQVGFAATVADGHPRAKERAHWIAPSGGGRGAVRELCELLLDAQGNLAPLLATRYAPSTAGTAH